jgi:uncharacterized membrane protein YfcA
MDISLPLIFLSICAFFTSIISAITGMAGGIVLFSIMTFFFPISVIIPIHGVVQLVSNSSRTLWLRKSIKKEIFIPFLIGAPAGAFISTIFIHQVLNKNFPLFLIALLIFYTVFRPKKLPSLKIPNYGFLFVGFVAGLLGILIGPTGPFIAPFFLRDDLQKEEIVATKSSVQIIVHLLKLPSFLYLGFRYQDHILSIVLLCLAAIIGTKYGVGLLKKLPEKVFLYIFKGFLLLQSI